LGISFSCEDAAILHAQGPLAWHDSGENEAVHQQPAIVSGVFSLAPLSPAVQVSTEAD
jgi:hypothetical protein